MTRPSLARPIPTSSVEFITPERAAALLARNTEGNRSLRDYRVLAYAESIRAGRFYVTGQGITIDWNGDLIDGQHRLHAIIAAGVGAYLTVCHGADPDSFGAIDRGLNRLVADAVSRRGIANAGAVGAAAKVLASIERDNRRLGGSIAMEEDDVMAFVEKYTTLTSAALLAKTTASRSYIPGLLPSGLAAAYTLISDKVGMSQVEAWDIAFRTGAGLEIGDGRLALRRNVGGQVSRKSGVAHAALTIKAWNACVARRRVAVLVWKSTEDFPSVQS